MYYTYILTNNYGNVMYVGVTNNLMRRLYEHKNDLVDGFTKTYRAHKLVYYEAHSSSKSAIAREKQLKGWNRNKKNNLVKTINPEFKDLSHQLFPSVF